MKLSLTASDFIAYTRQQLCVFYPDKHDATAELVQIMPKVMQRVQDCFSDIHKKYYRDGDQIVFNHRNSDHYAMFLYLLANEAWQQACLSLAEKAFLLNKALHGLDAFYSIALPDVFLFVHPVGTVLGHATYADFLVVYQNVTVGSDVAGIYPVFGRNVVLYAKSSVIGACRIGDNASIAAHALIRNTDVPNDSIAVGCYPHHVIKPNHRDNHRDFFRCTSLSE